MAVGTETRAAARAAYGDRCGYCGVHETSVGGELEMDHFHPLVAGGSDEIENLVYACTACNRFKGDYASAPDAPESLRLLHPRRDDLSAHIEETAHGGSSVSPRVAGFTSSACIGHRRGAARLLDSRAWALACPHRRCDCMCRRASILGLCSRLEATLDIAGAK